MSNNKNVFNPRDNYNNIMKTEEDVKLFPPYQHYISVKVSQRLEETYGLMETVDSVVKNTINNIPNGYEVYTIYPLVGETNGYIVWFVNNEEVKVSLSYNEIDNSLGYYTFGKVVQKEKVK